MNRIKIAHIADLHLNSPFSGLDNEKSKVRRNELIEAFNNLLKIAQKENVDIIAVSGDLFDNGDDMNIVRYVFECFKKCDIPVFISAGNHDSLSDIYNKITPPENVHIFKSSMECIEFNGVNIYGASFFEKHCPNSLLSAIETKEKINILIMHGCVGTGEYNPMPTQLLANFDYCALGHIHKHNVSRFGASTICYSGFCEARGFDEQGRGGIVIADVQKGNVNIKRYLLSKREYIKLSVDISSCRDNLDIVDLIQEQLKPQNIYSVELTDNINDFTVTPEYIKKCLDVFCFDINIYLQTQRVYIDLADNISLRGIFVSKILSAAENASENDKKRLMRALEIGLDAFEKSSS